MGSACRCVVVSCFFVGIAGTARGQGLCTLGFLGPDNITGPAASQQRIACYSTLKHEGDEPGAQAWSIAVSASGGEIVEATYEGTAAGSAEQYGLINIEIIDPAKNGGKRGFVEWIVLDFKDSPALVQNSAAWIARFGVEVTIHDSRERVTLAYEDGLVGSSQPVSNEILQGGVSRIPLMTEKQVEVLGGLGCCGEPINVGFSGGWTSSPVPWEGVAGDCGAGGEILASNLPAHVYADVISQIAVPEGQDPKYSGVQGWSLSVGLHGEADMVSCTHAGLADIWEQAGFVMSELIDLENPGNIPFGVSGGCLTAVVLHFKKSPSLPVQGTESLLDMGVMPRRQDGSSEAELRFVDGLVGSGEPVPNVFTVTGESWFACNSSFSDVRLKFAPRGFTRGNANGDARVDIADPIWTINEVLLHGPPSACEDATDANDDGSIDVSDVVYLISYQFGIPRPSPPPPAPFPLCGDDPTLDGLDCKAYWSCP
jgi:hypothetical protein